MPAINNLDGPDAGIFGAISELQRQVRDLANRNPFTGTNINMDGSGHLTVNGLQLHPITASIVQGWAQGYAVTVTSTQVVSYTVTVPTGYTTAIVNVSGEAEFFNNTTSQQYAQAVTTMTVSSGTVTAQDPAFDVEILAGGTNSITAVLAAVVTGINATAGETITISGRVFAGAALAASSFNAMALTGSVTFLA